MNVIRLLGDHKLTSPELTGEWEHRLAQIEEGTETRKKFMDDIAKFAGATVGELDAKLKDVRIPRANLGPCPVCGHDIVENRKGYSCWSREDPGCGFVIWKGKAGKQLPAAVAKELIATGRTAQAGHRLQGPQRPLVPREARADAERGGPLARRVRRAVGQGGRQAARRGDARARGRRGGRARGDDRRLGRCQAVGLSATLREIAPHARNRSGQRREGRRRLDAYREQLARGAEPILVVPRSRTWSTTARAGGRRSVFGVRVERFRGLIARDGAACRASGRPIGALARERARRRAIAATRLTGSAPRRRRRASRRRSCD